MKQIVKLVKGVQFSSSAKNALMQNVFQILADAMNVGMRKQMDFMVDSI
jgi:hypothetical protein